MHRGLGGRNRCGRRSRTICSRGRMRRISHGRPTPHGRSSSSRYCRRSSSGQSHSVFYDGTMLSGRVECGHFSRTVNRNRGISLRAFRGRRRRGGSPSGRVGPLKRRGSVVRLLRIDRRLLPVGGLFLIRSVRGGQCRGIQFGRESNGRDRGIVIRVRHGHGRVYGEIRGKRGVGRRRPERGLKRGMTMSVRPGRCRRCLREIARRGRLFGASVVNGYDA